MMAHRWSRWASRSWISSCTDGSLLGGEKQKQFSQASLKLAQPSKAPANSVLHMAIRSEGLSKLEQQDETQALTMSFTHVS